MSKFMYGVGQILFREFVVGYIKRDSFDMGGVKPEVSKIYAEQLAGTAALVIPQSNGSIAPNFVLIQLDYANLHKALGGTLHYAPTDTEKKKPIGWTPPKQVLKLEGPWRVDLVSGQSILIANAVLLSNLGGKLTLKETAELPCVLELQPADEGEDYAVIDTSEIPDQWHSSYVIPSDEVFTNVQEG